MQSIGLLNLLIAIVIIYPSAVYYGTIGRWPRSPRPSRSSGTRRAPRRPRRRRRWKLRRNRSDTEVHVGWRTGLWSGDVLVGRAGAEAGAPSSAAGHGSHKGGTSLALAPAAAGRRSARVSRRDRTNHGSLAGSAPSRLGAHVNFDCQPEPRRAADWEQILPAGVLRLKVLLKENLKQPAGHPPVHRLLEIRPGCFLRCFFYVYSIGT